MCVLNLIKIELIVAKLTRFVCEVHIIGMTIEMGLNWFYSCAFADAMNGSLHVPLMHLRDWRKLILELQN